MRPLVQKPIENAGIAEMLDTLADLLEIEGENPFRVRAYRNAARTVRDLPHSLAALVAGGEDLAQLPGIGRDLAGKLVEIVETGRFRALEEARRRVPVGLAELIELPGIGPKRAKALHDEIGITTREELAAALKAGRVRGRHGFGERTEQKLLHELERRQPAGRRLPLAVVEPVAEALREHLRAVRGVRQVVVAGSFRRRQETIGDLDILITCKDPVAASDRFLSFGEVEEVLARGATRSTVRLRSGLQVDLRVVGTESYGAALQYFTGSVAHNIAVRRLAQRRGLKLNEYGVFRGKERVGGRSERDVFRLVGLRYVEPELRENRGEIEAALEGRLPRLVSPAAIRGDLHVHAPPGGEPGLRALAEAARARGYEYLAIADRTARAHGQDPRRLGAQLDEIDRLNESLDGLVLLKAAEIEILEDGALDLPERLLRRLDLAVCAVHQRFDLPRARQTERVVRALANPSCAILAHPTGRLLGEPAPPYELDLERVIETAREHGRFLELNARPDRFDLDDVHCKLARESGVKVAICSSARTPDELAFMRFGVDQARRGWLEPADIVNTRSLPDLRRLLAARRHANG
jgi:DNA polymerase (family 10)